MKHWLVVGLAVLAVCISGCSKPTDPAPAVPTATAVVVVATATSTPTAGGGGLPTPTPFPTFTPIPTITPGGTTYTVMYEIITTDTNWVQFTYLDNYNAYPTNIASGPWTQTVTMNSGFKTELVCAYTGPNPLSAAVTVNIYVNAALVATQSRTGVVPAFTTEYWLP